MGIDITRQPLSVVMTQFFLLILLFWCRGLVAPAPIESVHVMSDFALGQIIDQWIAGAGLLGTILIMATVFLNAILITRIVTRNMVLGTRTYIPSLFYLMVAGGIYAGASLSGYLVGTLVIYASSYLILGFRRVYSFDYLFSGGFLFGVTPLLSFETILLAPVVVTALVLFRRSLREAIVAIAGVLLPLLIASYVSWGMGYDFLHLLRWGWQSMNLGDTPQFFLNTMTIPKMVFVCLLILAMFMSAGAFFANKREIRTRAYRIFRYFTWLQLFALTIFVLPCHSTVGYSVVAIAIAVIAPYYFVKCRGRAATILYTLLLVTIIVANLLPLIFLLA